MNSHDMNARMAKMNDISEYTVVWNDNTLLMELGIKFSKQYLSHSGS